MEKSQEQDRQQILDLVADYCRKYHLENKKPYERETEFLMHPEFMIQKNGKSCGQCSGILADSRQICR